VRRVKIHKKHIARVSSNRLALAAYPPTRSPHSHTISITISLIPSGEAPPRWKIKERYAGVERGEEAAAGRAPCGEGRHQARDSRRRGGIRRAHIKEAAVERAMGGPPPSSQHILGSPPPTSARRRRPSLGARSTPPDHSRQSRSTRMFLLAQSIARRPSFAVKSMPQPRLHEAKEFVAVLGFAIIFAIIES
jgi:hypothetical protein